MVKCPECGGSTAFLSGESAHPSNRYCLSCDWEAWKPSQPPTDQPAAGDDKEELLAERPELAFCPERCPKCESDDLHSEAIGDEEAVSCCDCDWIATYTNLREAMLNAGIPNSVPCAAQETPKDEYEQIGWIQEMGERYTHRLSFHAGGIDPREVHDNGKPCYPVYRKSTHPADSNKEGAT